MKAHALHNHIDQVASLTLGYLLDFPAHEIIPKDTDKHCALITTLEVYCNCNIGAKWHVIPSFEIKEDKLQYVIEHPAYEQITWSRYKQKQK